VLSRAGAAEEAVRSPGTRDNYLQEALTIALLLCFLVSPFRESVPFIPSLGRATGVISIQPSIPSVVLIISEQE